MAGVDDIIGAWVKQAEKSGELKAGKYFGKPLDLNDGFAETPVRLRMAYRILKNSGYVPMEVEMLKELADLKERLAAATADDERQSLERQIAELVPKLRMFIDKHAS